MCMTVRNIFTSFGSQAMPVRNIYTLFGTYPNTMRNILTVFGKIWGTFLPYLVRCSRIVGFPAVFPCFFILVEQFCLKKQRKTTDFHDFSRFFFFFWPRLSRWLEPASSQGAGGSLQPGGWGQLPASLQTVHSQPSTGTPGSINLYIDIKVMNHTNNEGGSFMLAAWRLQPEALRLKFEACLVFIFILISMLLLILITNLEVWSLQPEALSLKLAAWRMSFEVWRLSSIMLMDKVITKPDNELEAWSLQPEGCSLELEPYVITWILISSYY